MVTVNPNHICVGAVIRTAPQHGEPTSLVAVHSPCNPSIAKKTTPSEITDAIKLHHKVSITYGAAKRAKKYLLGDDLDSQAMQFHLLPAFMDAVHIADPQAHVRLSVENREGTRRIQ